MRATVLITRKDLRQRLRDRTAIVTALVLPLVMTMVLDTTTPNLTDISHAKFKFGVVNEDHGAAALFLVKEVLEPLQSRKLLQLYPTSFSGGRALVRDGKVNTTLVVPPGFSEATSGETASHLEIVGNGQIFKQASNYVARSIALSFANQSNGVRLAIASTRRKHGTSAEFIRLGEHASTMPKQLAIHETGLPSKELDLKTREAAGLAILFLFLTVQFGFITIIDERTHGTLARLLAASVSRRAIVGGKLLTSVVLGLFSMTVLVVASTLALGAHWGGLPGVALLVLVAVLAATAMTACLASFARTSEQALQWQVISAGLLGALGGALFPVAQAGGVLAWLSTLTPQAQFLRGLGVLSHGAGPGAVLPTVEAILAFAAVLGGVAALRIRHLVQV